jgi:hypothetical protein
MRYSTGATLFVAAGIALALQDVAGVYVQSRGQLANGLRVRPLDLVILKLYDRRGGEPRRPR